MVQLSKYALETDAVKMVIKNPATGEDIVEKGKSPYLMLYGPHTKQYRAVERKIQKKFLKKYSSNKHGDIDLSKIDLDEMEQIGDERIISCIAGWGNLEEDDGKTSMEFNIKNVKSLLDDPGLGFIIKEQIVEFVAERENFIKGS